MNNTKEENFTDYFEWLKEMTRKEMYKKITEDLIEKLSYPRRYKIKGIIKYSFIVAYDGDIASVSNETIEVPFKTGEYKSLYAEEDVIENIIKKFYDIMIVNKKDILSFIIK